MDVHLYHLQLQKYVAVFLWSIAPLTISVFSNCDANYLALAVYKWDIPLYHAWN